MKSVLYKSEQDLLRNLEKKPNAVNKTNGLGQTALHLAVNWPYGLGVLLQTKANIDSSDNYRHTPFDYAIQLCNAQNVYILINVGCRLGIQEIMLNGLYAERDSFTFAAKIVCCHSKWETFCTPERGNEMLKSLILALAERRRGVQLRLTALPLLAELRAKSTPKNRLLDKQALLAEKTLVEYDPSSEFTSTSLAGLQTVYHMHYLTAGIASPLWQAGFRDVDEID